MSAPLIHIDDLQFAWDLKHGDRFEAKLAPVAPRIGARKLGYNVTVVPPGKRAFPFHNHHANEEIGGRQPVRPLAEATFAAKFVPESADVDYYHGE